MRSVWERSEEIVIFCKGELLCTYTVPALSWYVKVLPGESGAKVSGLWL